MITRLSDITKTVLGSSNAKPLNLEKYPIRKILFKGEVTKLSYKMLINKIWISILGTTSVLLEDYKCPRCNAGEGHVAIDGEDSMYFCANEDCLSDDGRYFRSSVPWPQHIKD